MPSMRSLPPCTHREITSPTFHEFHGHALNEVFPPLGLAARHTAVPVCWLKLGEAWCQVHERHSNDLRLPLQTQGGTQAEIKSRMLGKHWIYQLNKEQNVRQALSVYRWNQEQNVERGRAPLKPRPKGAPGCRVQPAELLQAVLDPEQLL